MALILAAVGIHGVVAQAANRRLREVAVRLALGARPGQVILLVTRQAVVALLVGILLGSGLAVVAARAIRYLLFGAAPAYLPASVLAIGLLVLVAVVAAYAPARRAARVDVLTTLRSE